MDHKIMPGNSDIERAVKIRFVEREDLNQVIDLCRAHALYEQSDYSDAGKQDGLLRDLFSTIPKLYCIVAEVGANLVGYATYMKQYATWEAGEYVYMDCLFVAESVRGQRIGEQLVERIKEESLKMGCSLIQWQTPDFNTRAIKFYNRIGATSLSKERFFLEL